MASEETNEAIDRAIQAFLDRLEKAMKEADVLFICGDAILDVQKVAAEHERARCVAILERMLQPGVDIGGTPLAYMSGPVAISKAIEAIRVRGGGGRCRRLRPGTTWSSTCSTSSRGSSC